MSPALAKVIEKIEQAGLPDSADVPLDSAKAWGREPFRETLLHVVAVSTRVFGPAWLSSLGMNLFTRLQVGFTLGAVATLLGIALICAPHRTAEPVHEGRKISFW